MVWWAVMALFLPSDGIRQNWCPRCQGHPRVLTPAISFHSLLDACTVFDTNFYSCIPKILPLLNVQNSTLSWFCSSTLVIPSQFLVLVFLVFHRASMHWKSPKLSPWICLFWFTNTSRMKLIQSLDFNCNCVLTISKYMSLFQTSLTWIPSSLIKPPTHHLKTV